VTINSQSQTISAAAFVQRYPALFELYHEVMALTMHMVERKSKAIIDAQAAETKAIHQAFADTTGEAAAVKQQATRGFIDSRNEQVQEANAILNRTLAQLLAEKSEAERPHRAEYSAEVVRLNEQLAVDEECCRELGLVTFAFEVRTHFESHMRAARAQLELLVAPGEQHYQRQVRDAFALYNGVQSRANAECQRLCLPFQSEYDDIVATATRQRDEALHVLPWKYEQQAEDLQTMVLHLKQERLQLIESFCKDPCEVTLRQQLEAAIEEMRAQS
jgi:hypothetical protein